MNSVGTGLTHFREEIWNASHFSKYYTSFCLLEAIYIYSKYQFSFTSTFIECNSWKFSSDFYETFFFKYYSYPLRTELLCYLNSQDWLQIWLWTFNYLIYYQNIKPHQNPLCGTHHRAVHVYRIIPVSPCVHGWSTTQNSINLYPFTRCLYYDHNHKTSILRLDID